MQGNANGSKTLQSFLLASKSEGERGLANARPLSPIFQVLAHRLDKRFVIGNYFGTGTFERFVVMPSGNGCSKLLLWMGFYDGFHFDFLH